ncbi:MAG: ferredoxin--NADP reductase, partial [Bdellovibrionales bacterium]|nr:ferredoxin--NADP reductase [Bdellovibrionales bacterium]
MLNATVVERIDITSELVVFHIKPDTAIPSFKPGQYVSLGLPGSAPRPADFPPEATPQSPDKLIKRAYSIGSSPSQGNYLEFYIAIAPTGALTSRLYLLKAGDRVFMHNRIVGTFTLDDIPPDHNLVMVSTGTGIAPYMSMLRTPETWAVGRKISLLHGVRFSRDLAYRDELLQLQERNSNFRYYATVSRDDPEWDGEKGYVQQFFEPGRIDLDPKVDRVFICGNPGMIEAVQKLLEPRGYTEHTRRSPGNL